MPTAVPTIGLTFDAVDLDRHPTFARKCVALGSGQSTHPSFSPLQLPASTPSQLAMLNGLSQLARRLSQGLRAQHALASKALAPAALAHAMLIASALIGSAAAQSVFTFPIDGPQMGTISPGTGVGSVTLNTSTGIVTTSGTFTGMLGNVLAAHIHGPALPGAQAPIKFQLTYTGTTSGTFGGSNQATPQDVQGLLSGLYYVVLHTSVFGGGEVRGQIVTPAAATPYGSGINPANSLVTLAGTPSVPSTLTLGIDNPTGSQAAPGPGMLFLATQADPLFALTGTGIQLPGFGMSGPSGELLISVAAPNPFMTLIGHGWSGAGNPLPVALTIPNLTNLVGVTLYVQGALLADSRITLTNGLELYLGL
jgi:hypothetical protein